MTRAMSTHLWEALGRDFFSVREQFTDEQWTHFITVRKPLPARTAAAARGALVPGHQSGAGHHRAFAQERLTS
jgi:hypothetical protein